MNLDKSENSYLKNFHKIKNFSTLKPVNNKKEKQIKYDNLKDWEELNYEKENDKIIANNLDTSPIRQIDTNIKSENNRVPHNVSNKQDSPSNISFNTSMFTNKYNELTDKIDLSQMTTSYQQSIKQKKNNLSQILEEVEKLDACNSYKDKNKVIEEKEEEYKLIKSTSNENKLIEIDGNLIFTDRSLIDELDSLYLDDSLNDIDAKVNQEKKKPSNEFSQDNYGIETNKDLSSINKINPLANRLLLNPILPLRHNYIGADSNEIFYRNLRKNRISSPYIKSIPLIESECKKSEEFALNDMNNDQKHMYYPPNYFNESVNNNILEANSLYYYSNNLLNQHHDARSFLMNINARPQPSRSNGVFISVNNSTMQKSCSTSNTVNKKEHSFPSLNISNVNRIDSKNNSFNNFKKSYSHNKEKNGPNSFITYRPFSCKDPKTNSNAEKLRPLKCVIIDMNNKKSEGKNSQASTEKPKPSLRPQFNLENLKEELKVDLIPISGLISPKSKVNQDLSYNQTSAKDNGYSHIHSIKRLQSGKKNDNSIIGSISEMHSESKNNSIMRRKSSARLKPFVIDNIKNYQPIFSKVYTTLHDKKICKNTNDSQIDNRNIDISAIGNQSNLLKNRSNSSKPNIRLNIKKEKDYIQIKENSIVTLLEKNKILNEKVEKIKNYFNFKTFK